MSSPRYGHPEAHRAVGRDIIYTIILYYILLYIELRESQTATITFSSMLQFTPDCTALSLTVERWLAVTLHMSLSGHAVERWLAVITRNSCQSWNISTRANLSRHKSSWTCSPVHGESERDKSKTFARYASIRSLCMGSCRPLRLAWTHWRSFKTDSQNWHFYSENSRSFCFL